MALTVHPARRSCPHPGRVIRFDHATGHPLHAGLFSGKRSVAFGIDWPGWSRGARSAELALETLDHAWEMEDKDLSAQDGA